MKKRQFLPVSLLTVFACLIPQPSYGFVGFDLEAAAGYWWQSPSGDVQFFGDRLDLENDLRYDTEARPFGRVKLDLPAVFPNIYLMVTPMEFEEAATKAVTFNFGGQPFTANVPFNSRVKLDQYDIAVFYSLPFLETATLGKLNADLGVDLKIIDFETEISQATTSASESFTLPIPMLYAALQLQPVERFGIEAEARGLGFSSANYYVDIIGRAKIKLIGPLFAAGGYRYQVIRFDVSDVLGSFEFHGPFVEVGVRF
ncbi:MAG: TIGR04219 family outer membrane beta-barrel protein [Candidatus Methylomirabilia bacterium]